MRDASIAPADVPPTEPLMRAHGIRRAFHGQAALADVNFSVLAGEVVAVLGPSGAGKTTLFRCLAGLVPPDAGSVWMGGHDIARAGGRDRRRLARDIAVVFQQFNLVGRLTALDNVLAGRLGHVPAWRGWSRRFSRADRLLALECLDRVGLLARADQRADSLSGGQQQRVAIARALAQRSRLIVADEPVASLDPATAGGVLDLLRDIARTQGVGVVCSLHQVDLARAAADRIVGLAGGQVVVNLPAASFDDAAAARLYGAP
ncbi:phosphonate ABC transporter ATP-binding protein [Nitrospirillum sp. BR 11164]|uniref:phosphonate ABC transporter ATP-binding protein n=1 Tax=Nitrospirillum sp. BR 11164 TaxID=3104324 RepID=UPI002AFF6DA5|nr:phosphonate ABC transporter ATP-binding protein [Nitrospirillum sp. BR 11164]MEA1648956.1 phosphonate ABC transporter ATP-binding protein [Nitrospirillum sp. BR 11164]